MYTAKGIKSDSKPIERMETWEQIAGAFAEGEAKAVVWYYDKIEFYYLSSGVWDRPPRADIAGEVVRARIFNPTKEAHIWRSNNILKGRLREDAAGSGTEYVRAHQILNGALFETEGDFLHVTEEKGIDYRLPFKDLLGEDKKIERLQLITRNYIGYNKAGQAGYVDCRFEAIEILNF